MKKQTLKAIGWNAKAPAAPTYAVAVSLQNLQQGVADAGQQKIALDWIINRAAGTYEQALQDNDRDTCFGLGRQFVGQQIVGVLKVNVSTLERGE